MRKSIFIALVSLFLAVLLISCDSKNQDDPTPSQPNQSGQTDKSSLPRLSVLVDLPSAGSGSVDDFFSYVPGNGKSFLIITETLPPEGQERSAALTRIRTEILAGKGPDVFICTCWVPVFGEEGLFKFPNQAMENRIFLPLDDYISGAKYMEWDRLLPVVMEAGKGQEGQMLLPLAYRFDVFLLDRDRFSSSVEFPATWDELAESGDKLARSLAGYVTPYDMMGELADYDKDVPAFSEDELFEYMKKVLDHLKKVQSESIVPIFLNFSDSKFNGPDYTMDLLKGREFDFFSTYNKDGGITADITAFAGINRNSAHPDEAFTVLDFLLNRDVQKGFTIYSAMHSLPTHMDLYSNKYPAHGQAMSEEHFESFSKLRDQINVAKFYTPLEGAMLGITAEFDFKNGTEDELRKIVHKHYMEMSMMLAES